MKKTKMLTLLLLVFMLAGCTDQSTIDLDKMKDFDLSYNVRIDFKTGENINGQVYCSIDYNDVTCIQGENEESFTLNDESLPNYYNAFLYLYLDRGEFTTTDPKSLYTMETFNNRYFLLRLPEAGSYYESDPDSFDDWVDDLGEITISVTKGEIKIIKIQTSISENTWIVYNFS